MGYLTKPAYNPFTAANGDYGSYLAAAGENAILVLPESIGADSTYAKDLATPAKVDSFFKNVEALLSRAGAPANDATPRFLSGHSGAYDVLGQIGSYTVAQVPALASVRAFALFDCGYGYRDGLVRINALMKANGSAAYFSAYNPTNSAGKLATNLRLQRALGNSPDVVFIQNRNAPHMSFMREYMTQFFAFAHAHLN